MESFIINICPTCGSDKIQKVCKNWTTTVLGKQYTVPSLEYYECPECGEELYDSEAMRKIERYSPNIKKSKENKTIVV
ncbi:YgiT-type zinc finger protein [candidate division KSB1 bacterium]|nr:YgiT-type zinc finger protein [candidate division KSB1 bacterium]